MAVAETTKKADSLIADKDYLRQLMDEHNALTGFVPVPDVTLEMVRAMVAEDLRKHSITPEDRIFSRGIIEMREE